LKVFQKKIAKDRFGKKLDDHKNSMNQDNYRQLALKWAPIHYQYIKLKKEDKSKDQSLDDVSLETKTDLLVPVNLDAFLNPCKKCLHAFEDHSQSETTNCNFPRDIADFQNQRCDCEKFIQKYTNSKNDQEDAWSNERIRDRLENTMMKNVVPVVYYSIATTENYFFILYSFYHANDKKHPNDMEGCLIIIEREDAFDKVKGDKDKLVGMMTVAHLFFPSYLYKERLELTESKILDVVDKYHPEGKDLDEKSNYKKNIKKIKKKLHVLGINGVMEAVDEKESSRALTQQEAEGHGFYALGRKLVFPYNIYRKILIFFNRLDFIVYYPSEKAKPYKIDDLYRYKGMPHSSSLYYELVDIHDKTNGLSHRIPKPGEQNSTFLKNGKFHADKANPPWLWVEKIGKEKLYFWRDPAKLANAAFKPNEKKPFINKEEKYIKTMSQISDGINHESFEKIMRYHVK